METYLKGHLLKVTWMLLLEHVLYALEHVEELMVTWKAESL